MHLTAPGPLLGKHIQREWQLQTYHDRTDTPKGHGDRLSLLLYPDPLFVRVKATPGSAGRRVRRKPLIWVPQLDMSQLQAGLGAAPGKLASASPDTPDLSPEPSQFTQPPSKPALRDLDLPPLPDHLNDIAAAIDVRHPPAASPEHFIKNRAARYLLWRESKPQEKSDRHPNTSLGALTTTFGASLCVSRRFSVPCLLLVQRGMYFRALAQVHACCTNAAVERSYRDARAFPYSGL